LAPFESATDLQTSGQTQEIAFAVPDLTVEF